MGLVNAAYAEFVVAPASAWVEIPAGIDLVDAAALPLVLLTGTQLIEEAVRPRSGDVVLVTGAAGGVGRAAVSAALALGAQVWAGVRGEQRAAAEQLGAQGVVALDSDEDLEKLPPLDSIADTVGGEVVARLLPRVRRGGTVGSVVGEPAGARERGLIVRTMMSHPDATRLGALALAVADGKLSIPIARRMPLAEAREAQDFAEHHSGKVILTGPPLAFQAARPPAGQPRAPQPAARP
jgi:NADPH:quinone reductase-like Zn-dependent oxidoreductase